MTAPITPFVIDTKPTAVAPGSAGLIVPPESTYVTQFNVPWHVWPWRYDEALLDSYDNAIRMRRDPVISNPMDVRTRATVLQTWHIEPDDDTVEAEVVAAADVEWRIRQMPRLLQFMTTLLWNGVFLGREGAQVYYKWHTNKDRVTGLLPFKYDPVHGGKLVFGFGKNQGKVGIRVWSSYDGPKEQTDYGWVRWFDGRDRVNLVIHQHNIEDADFMSWQKGGTINGVGLQDRLYWTWGLKNQVLAYLVDYLQWFARGLTVYYYDAHNAEALTEVTSRVNEHTKSGLPVLLYPRNREGGPGYNPVQRVEPGTAGNNLILELVTQYFDDLIRRTILGQDATTISAGSSALGDGRAQLHQTTFDHVVKWDSLALEETLSSDLVRVIYAFTYPGMTPGRWKFETESPNVEQLLASAQGYVSLGGTVDAEELRKAIGLPPPKPGAQLLGNVQPMQPAAVGGMPENVPVVTPPGETQTGPVA